ncbi:hypothetical protein ACJX0J_030974, partial [Zea mays]
KCLCREALELLKHLWLTQYWRVDGYHFLLLVHAFSAVMCLLFEEVAPAAQFYGREFHNFGILYFFAFFIDGISSESMVDFHGIDAHA